MEIMKEKQNNLDIENFNNAIEIIEIAFSYHDFKITPLQGTQWFNFVSDIELPLKDIDILEGANLLAKKSGAGWHPQYDYFEGSIKEAYLNRKGKEKKEFNRQDREQAKHSTVLKEVIKEAVKPETLISRRALSLFAKGKIHCKDIPLILEIAGFEKYAEEIKKGWKNTEGPTETKEKLLETIYKEDKDFFKIIKEYSKGKK